MTTIVSIFFLAGLGLVIKIYPGSILLNITRSSSTSEGLNSSIKKQMDALLERKNEFMFWTPQGLTPEQTAEQWVKTDYTTATRLEGANQEMAGVVRKSAAYDADELALLARRFEGRSRPTEFVMSLRELAKEGRKYLAELEASVANEHGLTQDAAPSIQSNVSFIQSYTYRNTPGP
jgi:hypothetical protein